MIKSFADVDQFIVSAARFARAGYRIEVAAIAARPTDSRQRTLVNNARALELDVQSELPTPAAHARAGTVGADIAAAAAADPAIAAVRVSDGDHRALGATGPAGFWSQPAAAPHRAGGSTLPRRPAGPAPAPAASGRRAERPDRPGAGPDASGVAGPPGGEQSRPRVPADACLPWPAMAPAAGPGC